MFETYEKYLKNNAGFFTQNIPTAVFPPGQGVEHTTKIRISLDGSRESANGEPLPETVYSYQLEQHASFVTLKGDEPDEHEEMVLALNIAEIVERRLLEKYTKTVKNYRLNGSLGLDTIDFIHNKHFRDDPDGPTMTIVHGDVLKFEEFGNDYFSWEGVAPRKVMNPKSPRYSLNGEEIPFYRSVPSQSVEGGTILEVNPEYINAPIYSLIAFSPLTIERQIPEILYNPRVIDARVNKEMGNGDKATLRALIQHAIRPVLPHLGCVVLYNRDGPVGTNLVGG